MSSETSLDRPFMRVNSCGPFREVVDLQDFPKYGKDTILLFRFCEKPVDREGRDRSVKAVGMEGFTVCVCVFFVMQFRQSGHQARQKQRLQRGKTHNNVYNFLYTFAKHVLIWLRF